MKILTLIVAMLVTWPVMAQDIAGAGGAVAPAAATPPAVSAKPITREEIQAIVDETMKPEVWNDLTVMESYSRKYYAPNVHVRSVDEVVLPDGTSQQVGDRVYNNLDELLAASRKSSPPDGKLFTGNPKVSGELSDFKYDVTTGKAGTTYRVVIEGTLSNAPMSMKVLQVCRGILERQADQSIKMTMASCRQRMAMTPVQGI